jgi:antitoxin component YwqK of YwqJK toxin-antitoxin module
MVRESRLMSAGREIKRWERVFSDDGLLREEKEFDEEALAIYRRFSKAGFLEEETRIGAEQDYERTVYAYRENRLIKTETFDHEGKSVLREQYHYTRNGSLREMIRFFPDGRQVKISFNFAGDSLAEARSLRDRQMRIYRYTSRGLLDSIEIWVGEEMRSTKSWIYHEDGKTPQRVEEVSRKDDLRIITEYDEQGRKVRLQKLGLYEEERLYFYDEEGRIVRETYTEAAGKGEKRYEYDEEGEMSRESFYRRGRLEKVRIYTGENAWHEEIQKDGELVLRVYFEGGEKVREEFIRNGQVNRERAYEEE